MRTKNECKFFFPESDIDQKEHNNESDLFAFDNDPEVVLAD